MKLSIVKSCDSSSRVVRLVGWDQFCAERRFIHVAQHQNRNFNIKDWFPSEKCQSCYRNQRIGCEARDAIDPQLHAGGWIKLPAVDWDELCGSYGYFHACHMTHSRGISVASLLILTPPPPLPAPAVFQALSLSRLPLKSHELLSVVSRRGKKITYLPISRSNNRKSVCFARIALRKPSGAQK